MMLTFCGLGVSVVPESHRNLYYCRELSQIGRSSLDNLDGKGGSSLEYTLSKHRPSSENMDGDGEIPDQSKIARAATRC